MKISTLQHSVPLQAEQISALLRNIYCIQSQTYPLPWTSQKKKEENLRQLLLQRWCVGSVSAARTVSSSKQYIPVGFLILYSLWGKHAAQGRGWEDLF